MERRPWQDELEDRDTNERMQKVWNATRGQDEVIPCAHHGMSERVLRMTLVILDGMDRCGKTTLARELLRTAVRPTHLIHNVNPGTRTHEQMMEGYYEQILWASQQHERGIDVIMDRSHISESVYGQLYRAHEPIADEWLDSIKPLMVACDAVAIALTANGEAAWKRDDGNSTFSKRKAEPDVEASFFKAELLRQPCPQYLLHDRNPYEVLPDLRATLKQPKRGVIVVGEAPPARGLGPGGPLSRGGEVSRMSKLLGITELKWLGQWRVNLLREWPGNAGRGSRFDFAAAAKEAERLVRECDDSFLLVGKRVAEAFRVSNDYFDEFEVGNFRGMVVPHPSGASAWWNDWNGRANSKAAAFMEENA